MEAKDYRDGPVKVQNRTTTDLCCFILLVVLFLAISIMGVYAWSTGNFKQLTTAYDPDGKGCGVDHPQHPYIYFASPHSDSLWVTVCVSSCPKQGDVALNCKPNSVVKSCLPITSTDNTKAISIYDSKAVGNKACIPTSSTIKSQVASAFGGNAQQIDSLANNYSLVLISIPIAILIAIIFMVFIRLTANCFIYLLVVISFLALVALGVYSILSPGAISSSDSAYKTYKYLIAAGAFLLAILVIVIACCFKKQISLASNIIKVSSSFVASHPFIILLPLLLFFIMLAFVTLWVLQALGFYSMGTPITAEHQYPFAHFSVPGYIQFLFVVHVFLLIWVVLFLIDTGSFIIGGTATSWYYRTQSPYSQASQRYRLKHIGSVAKGSFFKALIGILKLIYQIFTPDSNDGLNTVQVFLKKCCDVLCCLCLKIFQFFTSGAYTMINISGRNFCPAGFESARLKMASPGSSAVMTVIEIIFKTLVQIGITGLTVLAIYLILNNVQSYRESAPDPTLIKLIVAVVAFAISCFFISVYSDTIESIYMTYLVDKDAGGDSKGLCPPELSEFLDEAKK